MFDECRIWNPIRDRGFEASIVYQVNRRRLGHIIDGGDEDDHQKYGKNLKEIELEKAPDFIDSMRAHTKDFDENWDEGEDENAVPKFNILDEFQRTYHTHHF